MRQALYAWSNSKLQQLINMYLMDKKTKIENKIIDCLHEAEIKLNKEEFDKLAESIISYINEISNRK